MQNPRSGNRHATALDGSVSGLCLPDGRGVGEVDPTVTLDQVPVAPGDVL